MLDLDVVEADAMEESDEILDIRNLEREEDLFDYGGIGLDVGGPSDDAPEDEWDPLNFDWVPSTSHAINHAVIQLYSGQVGYVAIDLVNVPMLLGTW